MKPTIGFGLVLLAGAALAAGCSDDETSNTTSTSSSSTSSSSGSGSGGSTSSSSAGGMGSGGSSDGGGGSSTMGATAACQMCVGNLYTNDAQCAANIQICDNDTACNDWKNCNEDCFNDDDTVACYDACDQNYPHNNALSDPLQTCTCNACATVCPASCS